MCSLVGQVETSSEILLVYWTHLVVIEPKILAAEMVCKDANNCLKFVCTFQVHAIVHIHDISMPISGGVFSCAF